MSPRKIWLDDTRVAPEGWVHVKTASDCIFALSEGYTDQVSLDYNLGTDEKAGTGYDVLLWMTSAIRNNGYVAPDMIWIHGANNEMWKKMSAEVKEIRNTKVLKKRQ
jgi:hypothetical protein